MTYKWVKVSLKDLINVKHGYAFKSNFFSLNPTEYILVTPGNFNIGGGFNCNKPKYYDGPIPEEYILKNNDLIITMTDLSKKADALGYSALIPSTKGYTFLHNQRIGLVQFQSTNISKYFLYYLLQSADYRHHIVATATGSTVKHTSPSRILEFEFNLPSLHTQQKIAKVLGDLDKKITLNNQINETLEAMAQALFKSWFIDFEPVKAKIEARDAGQDAEGILLAAMSAISGKEIEALKTLQNTAPEEYAELKAIAEQFPDSLEESALGLIPKGWEVKSLSNMIDIIGGGTPDRSNKYYWNGNVPWLSIKDLT